MIGLLLAGCLTACTQETGIRKYKVAKKDVVRQAQSQAESGKDQRMLGVIVPHEKSAWYFKLMDDPEKVQRYEADFRKIVESLRFESDGSPQWTLSDGWTDELIMQIVYARLTHATDGVSATVTQLPAATESEEMWRKMVYDNVNRWRGQLSLTPQDWESMQPELQEVPTLSQGSARAYFVSLVGKKADSGMNAPFMNQMSQPAATAPAPSPSQSQTPSSTASPAFASAELSSARGVDRRCGGAGGDSQGSFQS